MQPSSFQRKYNSRARSCSKRIGRPSTWNKTLLRKLIVLDIFTDLHNYKLVECLQEWHNVKSIKSLQNYRNQLLCADYKNWRPRDGLQMHKRITQICNERKPCYETKDFALLSDPKGSREFSPSLLPSPVTTDGPMTTQTQRGHYILSIKLVKGDSTGSGPPKTRISLSQNNGPRNLVELCDMGNMNDILSEMVWSFESEQARHWWLRFSNIDLSTYHLFAQMRSAITLKSRANRCDMERCCLREIPPAICAFSRLRSLNLSRNRLKAISAEMLPFSLEFLELSYNQLTEVPENLLQLPHLSHLILSYNRLVHLPAWLSSWSTLKLLLVRGNPLGTHDYHCYFQAFKYCMEGKVDEACDACLLRATSGLKKMLSQSIISNDENSSQILLCPCRQGLNLASTISDLVLLRYNPYLSTDLHKQQNFAGDLTALKHYLNCMSMTSLDRRSSFSTSTLKSMSSAESSSRLTRADKAALMSYHCCWRNVSDDRIPCIHDQVSWWLFDRDEAWLPVSVLHERDWEGNSVLHIAAALGATLKDLMACIDRGCSPGVINHHGETFLHRVVNIDCQSHSDVIDLVSCLRNFNFPFYHRDHYGNSLSHLSRRFKWLPSNFWIVKQPSLKSCRNATGVMVDHPSLQDPHIWFDCCPDRPQIQQPVVTVYFAVPTKVDMLDAVLRKAGSCSSDCLVTHQTPLHAFLRLIGLGKHKFDVWDFNDGSFKTRCETYDVLHRILERGADLNDYDVKGKTTLMRFIARLGRLQDLIGYDQVERCIKLLLDHGANACWIGRQGDTALHVAVFYALTHTVEELIARGANVNARNAAGLSILQLLDEAMHKRKFDLIFCARLRRCQAILIDHEAELDPTVAQEMQWNTSSGL